MVKFKSKKYIQVAGLIYVSFFIQIILNRLINVLFDKTLIPAIRRTSTNTRTMPMASLCFCKNLTEKVGTTD
ncbi:hypothetical protein GZ77_05015 [Endozoicomonas montiporae]|uniref:Uncharacterized protein n=2 Tax=Endozoicomonas montiporae TaxID=1027273 RepID=A0A081NBQ4_9GAMM|nr:hypothetical protein EZMO1_2055 [Endozoicomonas montiporae CL-33]KEQ15877.1 hypothetical protein GZ77_05015 [Endozoicomonas montiporae]